MMPPKPNTMVVFDLGGVLVRICRGWEEACRAAGEPFHKDVLDPANMAARKALVRQHEIGTIDCAGYYTGISATTGGLYSPSQVRAIHAAWLLGEYEGIGPVLDALDAAAIPTGILSNTNKAHWDVLTGHAGYASLRRIAHPHASHLLGHAKPHADIYHAFAARVAGKANGAGMGFVFFDDLADNIAGAQAAGWRAYQIDHGGNTAAQMLGTLDGLGLI